MHHWQKNVQGNEIPTKKTYIVSTLMGGENFQEDQWNSQAPCCNEDGYFGVTRPYALPRA
jgi:hypothetical protein